MSSRPAPGTVQAFRFQLRERVGGASPASASGGSAATAASSGTTRGSRRPDPTRCTTCDRPAAAFRSVVWSVEGDAFFANFAENKPCLWGVHCLLWKSPCISRSSLCIWMCLVSCVFLCTCILLLLVSISFYFSVRNRQNFTLFYMSFWCWLVHDW